jgi:5-carboxymethyl-2-hydroxymuconate isomerase
MPHIHLETTADLVENDRIPDILEALVAELCRHETINPQAVKAYHTLRGTWRMGEGATPGFAHCSCAILSGRPAELRRAIADGMYGVMRLQFADSISEKQASLTFELREMDAQTYRK